jgi:hypothetical protein
MSASGAWSTSPKCEQVTFAQPFTVADNSEVHVLVTGHHIGDATPGTHDAVTLWVENVTASGFRVCGSELDSLQAGGHDDSIAADWVAWTGNAMAPLRGGSNDVTDVIGAAGPVCGYVDMTSLGFSGTPWVQATAVYPSVAGSSGPALTLWLETVSATTFRYCVDTLANEARTITGVRVDWVAYEELPPDLRGGRVDVPAFAGTRCLNVDVGCLSGATCPLERILLTADHDAGSHDPVTTWVEGINTNGTVRMCVRETERANNSHNGQLNFVWLVKVPPVMQTGVHDVTAWNSSPVCERVDFPRSFTSSAGEVRVIVTADHIGDPTPGTHDAVSTWARDVDLDGFTACASELDSQQATAHDLSLRFSWLAFDNTLLSVPFDRSSTTVPAFTNATTPTCTDVDISAFGFGGPPYIQASLTYPSVGGGAAPAVTGYLEEITTNAFRYCVDTLANEARSASGLRLDFIAYRGAAPAGYRRGEVDVAAFSGSSCLQVDVGCASAAACPVDSIYLTANHDPDTDHDPITTWVESVNSSGTVTMCVRETERADGSHDAHVNLTWLIKEL